jgi:hypothetical protein
MADAKNGDPIRGLNSKLGGLRDKVSAAFKEIEEVKRRTTAVAKDVRELKDMFSKEDNWGSQAKRFIETQQTMVLTNVLGTVIIGKITWVDRYNIGILDQDGVHRILLKSGLVDISEEAHKHG